LTLSFPEVGDFDKAGEIGGENAVGGQLGIRHDRVVPSCTVVGSGAPVGSCLGYQAEAQFGTCLVSAENTDEIEGTGRIGSENTNSTPSFCTIAGSGAPGEALPLTLPWLGYQATVAVNSDGASCRVVPGPLEACVWLSAGVCSSRGWASVVGCFGAASAGCGDVVPSCTVVRIGSENANSAPPFCTIAGSGAPGEASPLTLACVTHYPVVFSTGAFVTCGLSMAEVGNPEAGLEIGGEDAIGLACYLNYTADACSSDCTIGGSGAPPGRLVRASVNINEACVAAVAISVAAVGVPGIASCTRWESGASGPESVTPYRVNSHLANSETILEGGVEGDGSAELALGERAVFALNERAISASICGSCLEVRTSWADTSDSESGNSVASGVLLAARKKKLRDPG
jgi:hypothetical protein